nr:hypothetical protein [Oceanococcus sp. HetDA_MAG_MS8]
MFRFTRLTLGLIFASTAALADPVDMTWEEAKALVDPTSAFIIDQCVAVHADDPNKAMQCAQSQIPMPMRSSSAPRLVPTGDTITSLTSTAIYLAGSVINAQYQNAPDTGTGQPKLNIDARAESDCTSYLAEPELYSSCMFAVAVGVTQDVGALAAPLAVGVCYSASDQPVVLVSTICRAGGGVFVAGAGNPATFVPVVVGRPNCLTNESSALHPGLGLSGGSFSVVAEVCFD